MGSLPRFRPVECKTIDGTIIAGNLYEIQGTGPAVIMSHGFNCIKEMTLPEVAETFQAAGFNVLLYDARSVGSSGGKPRNLADPLLMAEDLSDVYTYVSGLPNVDSNRIALWGMSFGAVVSATCAAVDRRAKALIMVCPLFSFFQPQKTDKAFQHLIKDRVSQLRGNPPYELAPFTPKGDNPLGFGGAGGPGGLEAYTLMNAAKQLGIPTFRDRITLQAYQKLAMFRPKEYMDMVQAPVMMAIPEMDDISPAEEQREAFGRIKSPKKEYWAEGKTHLNIASGAGMREMVAAQVEFIHAAFDGKSV